MEQAQMANDMAEQMETMKREIKSLREKLAEKEAKVINNNPDLGKIKEMLEEGFAKVTDAVRPVIEAANHKIGEPAKAVASRVEDHIVVHPFMSIVCALGAGLIIGKLMSVAESGYVRPHDSR